MYRLKLEYLRKYLIASSSNFFYYLQQIETFKYFSSSTETILIFFTIIFRLSIVLDVLSISLGLLKTIWKVLVPKASFCALIGDLGHITIRNTWEAQILFLNYGEKILCSSCFTINQTVTRRDTNNIYTGLISSISCTFVQERPKAGKSLSTTTRELIKILIHT